MVVTTSNGKTVSVTSGGPAKSSASPKRAPTVPIHVALKFEDGRQFGVGIPIIAFFTRRPTDGRAFSQATKVTVNGAPANGAWFFETSTGKRYPYEAHYRLQNYWPAHAQVHMDLPIKGLSAGPGLSYDDSLTSDFSTGAKNIAAVDDTTHMMTVTTDDRPYGVYPVSLGAADTPTLRGIKVIMEKGVSICMSGPGYHECGIKFTQRLTYGGEYLHSAPWNCVGPPGCVGRQNNIGRFDSSNGCTNLLPADAQKLYAFLQIGDVVTHLNANGAKMQLGQGYGDWNVPWSQWQTGGLVSTR